MKLVRWNPAREFEAVWNAFERAHENEASQPRQWGLALDVTENDEAYVLQASVPGVKPEDIEITFEKNVLTVRGESSR